MLLGHLFTLTLLGIGLVTGAPGHVQQAEVDGVRVKFVDYQGSATFTVQAIGKRSLRIDVDPRSEHRLLTLAVELPSSAQTTWAADVEVVDLTGRPLPARHLGIEWHRFTFSVPAKPGTYLVRAVEPPGGLPPVFPEREREATEPTTGLTAAIAKWYCGRKAALSIRFDDSHPSHLSTVIPILREYGFRGTFMICPGGSDFEDHRAEWEAVAQQGDQEFANHTAHHRGAVGDEDMEVEIGEAAKAIWKLFPSKSKLMALNLGGGTTWETTKTLRYYLDKYCLFDASHGSLGMDDVYGNRASAFRQHLQRHLETGGWCRIHFHAIGPGLNTSDANFRAAMEIAKEYESDLWIAGMADIYKYQTERQATTLRIRAESPRRALLAVSCFTDPKLYDQPLTIELTLPPTWTQGEVKVKQVTPRELSVPPVAAPDAKTVRFSVPPIHATYAIERTP